MLRLSKLDKNYYLCLIMCVLMIVEVINEYLASNRRLIVPSFGAFLVKEDKVIFSELLVKDDGVLRSLLMARGLSEINAAAVIDRFIYEVRHALERQSTYPIANFGTFSCGEQGVVLFDHTKPSEVIPIAGDRAVQPAAAAASAIEPAAIVTPIPIRPAAPHTAPQPAVKRKGSSNWVIWVAVAVIALALAALSYGLYCMSTMPADDLDARMDEQRIPMIDIPQQNVDK